VNDIIHLSVNNVDQVEVKVSSDVEILKITSVAEIEAISITYVTYTIDLRST